MKPDPHIKQFFQQAKLEASALSYTLVIALLISLLLSSMIFLFGYSRSTQDAAYFKELAHDNLDSGLAVFFYGSDALPERLEMQLFGSDIDSVFVRREAWGLFGIAHVRGKHGPSEAEKTVLFGAEPAGSFGSTLFLADQSKPLSLAGKTRIEGTAFLPQAGLRRGMVGRENYLGEKLIYGTTEKSAGKRCAVDYENVVETREMLERLAEGELPPGEGQTPAEVHQDWAISARIFSSGQTILLEDQQLSGHLIIAAPEIFVSPTAQLDQALLFARSIHIAPGFTGRLQAFATDTITLGADAHLAYPSVLLVAHPEGKSHLHLAENALLEGMAINDPAFIDGPRNKQGGTRIDSAATIYGNLYAAANLDLQGAVHGHTFTNNFRLRSPGSIYENHLLDALLTRRGLSETYAMGLIQAAPGPFVTIETLPR